jgi:hypothetical protein
MAGTALHADHGAVRSTSVIAAVAVLGALVAAGASGSRGAATAAPSFQLVFDGRHNAALLHEGTFTTSASFCAAGTAADLSVDSVSDTALREFTCAGAGGDFTARVTPLPAEHGGNGLWQIVAGPGVLANLRGKGTWSSTRLSGRLDDPATIAFRSTWQGVADFDVSPPSIAISSAVAHRLKRPKGAYALRVVLAFDDAVTYLVQVVDPRRPKSFLLYKPGTSAGAVTSTFRVKPAKGARSLRLTIAASDTVGNDATAETTVRLR